MKAIIFDFNRTLYNPDARQLAPNTRFILRTLIRRGFTLFLISRAGQSRRLTIEKSGIAGYFSRIITSDEKREEDFTTIVREEKIIPRDSFVVGDCPESEIKIGNLLGFKTICLIDGKFPNGVFQADNTKPTYVVMGLKEILKIIHW